MIKFNKILTEFICTGCKTALPLAYSLTKKTKMDLTTEKGRLLATEEIEKSFLAELRANGVELAEDAICRMYEKSIDIFLKTEELHYGEVHLYPFDDSKFWGHENEINFVASGNFTPENRVSYWRTIHAASILKNWDVVCKIVNDHCARYSKLRKKIFELNEK